ncbi:Tyrosine/nicotianamine aminotransferase [Trinorchestia longiramus]|nr:Tyrosine/nicotianamine aminotransferase [Trinorchestia longiramus]
MRDTHKGHRQLRCLPFRLASVLRGPPKITPKIVRMKGRENWNVRASNFSKKTFNPIRNIVENMKITPHPDKSMIALSIGDPTVFGNLKPAESVVQAVIDSVKSGKNNGYASATGTQQAKEAIATYMSCPGAPVDAQDVIICSGCSCSLDLCISAICYHGSSIIVPKPGFPLYTTLAKGYGVTSKYYNLLPEKNWLIDLEHLESLIDDSTAAIVVNNPSNPCGSVYPKNHLRDIANIAVKHKVPIIADEIYDNFVFEGQEYHPIASVHPELPVLACGGLTKRFLVPGWRTGWIAIHDRGGVLQEISSALRVLSQRIIGSNTIVQGALPAILHHTPQTFFDDTLKQIQINAKISFEAIKNIPGLSPIRPQGAMYMMVRFKIEEFPDFSSDLEFVEAMVAEESVFCLPGRCFDVPNYFRIVLTVPEETMREACKRMEAFCKTHNTAFQQGLIDEDSAIKKVKMDSVQSNGSTGFHHVVTNGNTVSKTRINGNDEDTKHLSQTSTVKVDSILSLTNGDKSANINGAKVDDLVNDMECD